MNGKLNKIEFALGILVTLLSLLALLAIYAGVGQSTVFPGRLAWRGASWSLVFMVFLPVLGIAVIAHGLRRSKTSESIWGIIVLFWSLFSWFWIPVSLDDGSSFFKGGFTETFITASWPLIVFVFQGIAIMIDSINDRQPASMGGR